MKNPHDDIRKPRICEWDENDRPRERFGRNGGESLTTAELLAILIGSGNARETAVDLMQRILNDCEGSLNRLGKRSIAQLTRYDGIGEAKAITILAACELGKRHMEETVRHVRLTDAQATYEYMHAKMMDHHHEKAYVLMLNANLAVIDCICISEGGICGTAVDIRRVLHEALLCDGCTGIILCHNHPSGNARPSRQDEMLTAELAQAAKTVHIPLHDHLIVTDGAYYSFAENGKI